MREQKDILGARAREFGVPEYLADELLEALRAQDLDRVENDIDPRIAATVGREKADEFVAAFLADLETEVKAALRFIAAGPRH